MMVICEGDMRAKNQRYLSIISLMAWGLASPLTIISTSPWPALAIDSLPTAKSLWKNDWSTCNSLTSECLTSRVRFESIPCRKIERLVVTVKLVVLDWRNQRDKINKKVKGNPQMAGASLLTSMATPVLASSARVMKAVANGLVRNMAGLTFKTSCSASRGGACAWGSSTEGGAGVGTGGGSGGTVTLSFATGAGICMAFWHAGHFAVFPAYLLGALIPFPQCGHSTLIDMATPPYVDKTNEIRTLTHYQTASCRSVRAPRQDHGRTKGTGSHGAYAYITAICCAFSAFVFLAYPAFWGVFLKCIPANTLRLRRCLAFLLLITGGWFDEIGIRVEI